MSYNQKATLFPDAFSKGAITLHLSHLGGNLNQAMHHINAMTLSGIDVGIAFGQEVLPLIITLQSSIHQLQSNLRLITDKLRSIR